MKLLFEELFRLAGGAARGSLSLHSFSNETPWKKTEK
jgi:hypothetical protein